MIRLNHEENEINIFACGQSHLNHIRAEKGFGLVNPRGVEENELCIFEIFDPENAISGRLWPVGSDRNLGSQDPVE
jgi:hypothetical protein